MTDPIILRHRSPVLAKSSWRDRLPEGVRRTWHAARRHAQIARDHGRARYVGWTYAKAALRLRSAAAARAYQRLDVEAVRAARRSETVFVFGSGYSLRELPAAAWTAFARHDVFGLSGFIYQDWVRTDFHLVRGWAEFYDDLPHVRRTAAAYARQLNDNPHFDSTILLLQHDHSAVFAHALMGYRLLRPGLRFAWYTTARHLGTAPSPSFRRGLTHAVGTLSDAVNAAALLGWRDIVLVGVDLYDSRYFWGPADATLELSADAAFSAPAPRDDRGVAWNAPHSTARNGVVDLMGEWGTRLAADGIRLSVYNPRSLLAGVLPVYG